MIAQLQVTTKTEIINTYKSDFDGLQIDTIRMTYPDGHTEIRYGWAEENLDGETVFYIKTSKGNILNSNWKSTENNKWMSAYKALWIQRYQAECETFQKSMEIVAQPEHHAPDKYEQAKADLGFDW